QLARDVHGEDHEESARRRAEDAGSSGLAVDRRSRARACHDGRAERRHERCTSTDRERLTMLWFKNESGEEKKQHQQHERDREASLAALQHGKLPPDALARLKEGFPPSDLSTNEFLLARDVGDTSLG